MNRRGRQSGPSKAKRLYERGFALVEISTKLQIDLRVVKRWLAQDGIKLRQEPVLAPAKALAAAQPWEPLRAPTLAELMAGK
jgi:uncharacterized protein YjcR